MNHRSVCPLITPDQQQQIGYSSSVSCGQEKVCTNENIKNEYISRKKMLVGTKFDKSPSRV